MITVRQAEDVMTTLVLSGITLMIKKQKTPFKIVEEKFGKEPQRKSDEKIKAYLDSKGYQSLSKLIEAK